MILQEAEKKFLYDKAVAIAQVHIDTAQAMLKCLAENSPTMAIDLFLIRKMFEKNIEQIAATTFPKLTIGT